MILDGLTFAVGIASPMILERRCDPSKTTRMWMRRGLTFGTDFTIRVTSERLLTPRYPRSSASTLREVYRTGILMPSPRPSKKPGKTGATQTYPSGSGRV